MRGFHFAASPKPRHGGSYGPSLATSLCGVAIGVGLLGWLSGGAVNHLRGLLGVSILGCATLLFLQTRPRSTVSSPWSFAVVGMLSGMLGGLFASSGPPLVYHMYRQPLERDRIRLALLLVFACNAFVRLILVVLSGQFSRHALLLAACAIPVVYGVTRCQLKHPTDARTGGVETDRRFLASDLGMHAFDLGVQHRA